MNKKQCIKIVVILSVVIVFYISLFFPKQDETIIEQPTPSPVVDSVTPIKEEKKIVRQLSEDLPPEYFPFPATFSSTTKEYRNDKLGFSFRYPDDISIEIDETTGPIHLGVKNTVGIKLNFEGREIDLLSFGEVSFASSTAWKYDTSQGRYIFYPTWIKKDTFCPEPFYGNSQIPSATELFGDGNWATETSRILLGDRVFLVNINHSYPDWLGTYSVPSEANQEKLRRNEENRASLRERIFKTLVLTRDEAQDFGCVLP